MFERRFTGFHEGRLQGTMHPPRGACPPPLLVDVPVSLSSDHHRKCNNDRTRRKGGFTMQAAIIVLLAFHGTIQNQKDPPCFPAGCL